MKVELLPSEVEILMISANGSGGYQSLIRALQKKIDKTSGEIVLTEKQIERIKKSQRYGEGSFQTRIFETFARVLDLGDGS